MIDLLNSPLAGALWTCLALATAASALSMTVTQTELFAPLRALAWKIHPQVGHLFQCFYCFSHWVVIAGTLVYRPVVIASGWAAVDWLVATFFTVALTALFCGLLFKVFLTAMAKAVRERELKKLFASE